jgi:predicted HTH transcriptional regulator
LTADLWRYSVAVMSDLERRLRERIDAFVEELTEIVREEALEQVAKALGGATTRVKRATRSAPTKRTSNTTAGRAPKRTQDDLVALEAKIIRHVGKNPGMGAQEIALAFGLTTADVTLPLRRLVRDNKLETKGQKRGTRYHPGG